MNKCILIIISILSGLLLYRSFFAAPDITLIDVNGYAYGLNISEDLWLKITIVTLLFFYLYLKTKNGNDK